MTLTLWYHKAVCWLKSEEGQNFELVLGFVISILLLLWLLKNHKIIKK
jgi:hypothetical protein